MKTSSLWNTEDMSSVPSIVAKSLIEVAVVLVLFAKYYGQPIPPMWAPSHNQKQCGTGAAVWHVQTKASPCQGSELPVLIPPAEAEDLTSENKSSISTVWQRRRHSRGLAGSSGCCPGGFRTGWRYRHTMFLGEMIRKHCGQRKENKRW